MAFTVSKLGGASASASPLGSGTFSAPTAGDLLICIASTGNNDATQQVTSVTDSASGSWTEISAGAGSQHDVKWWYKVSNGTETSVSVTYSTSTGNDMLVLRVTGWVNTPTLEDFDEFEGNLETADADGSVAAGTVANATASAIVIAFVASDGLGTVDGSGAMSDGSAYSASGDQGTQLYAFHREVSSTGTYSPVYTYSDSGDQVYTASAVFGDATAGAVESGAGSSAGTSTAAAVGASTAAASGSAAGAATAAGVGASTAEAVGTAAGTATASAVGDVAGGVQSGAGTSAGTSTASGVGASTAASVGTAAGSSTASAVGTDAASQIEAASLAGLRVHAAREAQFFFSKRRPARRTSRPNWPALRAA